MTEPNEPKKETTRISYAPATSEQAPEPSTKSPDTERLLPLEEPPVRVLAKPQPAAVEPTPPQFFQPPPSPAVTLSSSVLPAPDLPPSSPTKETVRIPVGAVQMKKTQPLVAMPDVAPQNPSIAIAPVQKNSMRLLWLLLGVSTVILIIQIWTYFS